MAVRFEVEGTPRAKGRPRFNRNNGSIYTPKATLEYERLIAYRCKSAMNKARLKPFKGLVKVEVNVYFKGKSLRPDLDNVIKAILDGMNGVAYEDDQQVSELIAKKHYKGLPKTEITVTEI